LSNIGNDQNIAENDLKIIKISMGFTLNNEIVLPKNCVRHFLLIIPLPREIITHRNSKPFYKIFYY
jgi:hypothetical protein